MILTRNGYGNKIKYQHLFSVMSSAVAQFKEVLNGTFHMSITNAIN